MCDGAAKAKLCLTAPGWQSILLQEMGMRQEEGERGGKQGRGRPTCLDPLCPAKRQWFRIITSDQLLGQGEIWRKLVLGGMRFGWSQKNLAALKQEEFP